MTTRKSFLKAMIALPFIGSILKKKPMTGSVKAGKGVSVDSNGIHAEDVPYSPYSGICVDPFNDGIMVQIPNRIHGTDSKWYWAEYDLK